MDTGACSGHLPHQGPSISIDRFSYCQGRISIFFPLGEAPTFVNPVGAKSTGFSRVWVQRLASHLQAMGDLN